MSAARYRLTLELSARPTAMPKRGDIISVILPDNKYHAAVVTHPRRVVLDDNEGPRVMTALLRAEALIKEVK